MKHKHHIIPKHMGGTDDPSNIVELTVRQHALAHKKLYEEHGHWQDRLAWQGLSGQLDKEDIIVERQREAGRRVKSPEERGKISRKLSGRKLSEAHKKAISEGRKGCIATSETRAKISKANTGNKHTTETRAKISQVQIGKTLSADHKKKISDSMKKHRAGQRTGT